ncbi:MAG: copper homeostasis protein CutC [Oscillospiraceae bacterium]
MCKKKTCLEVCVDSFASAMAAVRGGADRLELCSCLIVGGLTPDVALLEQIRRETELPIRCLMRPRFGDFLYTEEEIRLMEDANSPAGGGGGGWLCHRLPDAGG